MKLIPEKYNKESKPSARLLTSGLSKLGNYLSLSAGLLMFLSLVLLFGIVLAYFGLLGYENNLLDKKKTVENNVKELQSQRNLETEATLMELKEKINTLKSLSKIHVYPSKIFQILEELALFQVRFIDLQADLLKMQLKLNSEMANYGILAKQIAVFEEDPRINKVDVSDINLNNSGRVEASFLLRIDPSFLR